MGVVGVGSLGFHHARILRGVEGASLAGVFDIDSSRATQVAAELDTRAFPSLEALLGDAEGVVVAVPTTQHERVALEAIAHGAHLLIEKPIATTLEEADRILDAADERGVRVATGHVERFNGAVRACEPYLDEPRFVESHRLAPFGPRGIDVAVVLDLMIHDIDLILGLLHQSAVAVDAVGVPVLTPNVDIANARIRLANGAVANITASRVSKERLRKIRIFQRSGYLSLDLGTGTGEFLRLRKGFSLGDITGAGLEGVVERVELSGDGKEPLRAELEAFVAALREDGEMVVSGRDGRNALAVALQIVNSIETNVADQRPA